MSGNLCISIQSLYSTDCSIGYILLNSAFTEFKWIRCTICSDSLISLNNLTILFELYYGLIMYLTSHGKMFYVTNKYFQYKQWLMFLDVLFFFHCSSTVTNSENLDIFIIEVSGHFIYSVVCLPLSRCPEIQITLKFLMFECETY